jgi:histone H3/H4
MNDDQVIHLRLVREYVKSLMEDAMLGAQHAGRTSVTSRDIALAKRMRTRSPATSVSVSTPCPR